MLRIEFYTNFEVEATFCVFQCQFAAVFTCVLTHTILVWFNCNDSLHRITLWFLPNFLNIWTKK